jgi:hypothetical protein
MTALTHILRGSRRWRALAALALAGIATGSAGYSGAAMTARSSNPGASVGAGTVAVTKDRSGAVVSASSMRPGDSRQGDVTVTNSGNLAATLSLRASGLADVPASPALSSVLDLKVQDVTAAASTVYDGKLASFSSASLGAFAGGAARTYRFTISWPAGSRDPGLQGAQTSLTFRWGASA